MKTYVYVAALILCGSGLAQNQNQTPNQAQPAQGQPSQTQPGSSQDQQSTQSGRSASGLRNMLSNWRLEDLPAPVQKTVREQSAGQQIADIDREQRNGQTIWEVEFERKGRNPKIHVSNDGRLMGEQEVATLHKDYGLTPGVGAPAGAEAGRTKRMATQWEDLPQPIQQKAMQFGGKDKTTDIDLKHRNGKNVYALEFERSGRNLEVTFAEDGTILKSNDPQAAPAQGSPAGSQSTRDSSLNQPTQPQPQPSPQPQENQNRDLNRPINK